MGFFSNLFSKKGASVVGIDIGSSSVKVVQLAKKGGQAILETYGEIALGPYAQLEVGRAVSLSPEKISEAIIDVMREAKVTTRKSGIAIPFSASLITPIEMPAVAERQLVQMIPLEARKYIPVPISEVSLDWWVIPKSTDKPNADEVDQSLRSDKIDVLLVAIHNEVLTRNQTIVQQAGLETSFFEIEIFSTIRAALEQDTSTQMVLDLGAATSKAYIVERGIVRSSHLINRGSQDVTMTLSKSLNMSLQDAEVTKRDLGKVPPDRLKEVADVISLTLDYIFSEANRVILAYQKRHNKDVSKVVLVGGGAQLEGILELAQSNLQTEVVLGDPFGKTEAPAFLEEILKKTGPEFAVAVGVALRKLQETS